jgi:2-polyprenyl-3-methyl-5-hydroxy-6-metoxy-1,4-benzoquinol methylase
MSLVPGRPWNRNIHYHGIVLKAMPSRCARALDVGCGDGLLASELARRSGDVIAIDVDAPTLARARMAHKQPNLSFVEAEVMSHPFDNGSFDFIASIATLHHLPLVPALERFKRLLRPGGVLALVGLYRMSTPADLAWAFVAMPVNWWLRLTNDYEEVHAPIRDPDETLAEISRNVAKILPGAAIGRQLLFRYSLIWRKPSG